MGSLGGLDLLAESQEVDSTLAVCSTIAFRFQDASSSRKSGQLSWRNQFFLVAHLPETRLFNR